MKYRVRTDTVKPSGFDFRKEVWIGSTKLPSALSSPDVTIERIAANFRPSDLRLLNLIRKFQGRVE